MMFAVFSVSPLTYIIVLKIYGLKWCARMTVTMSHSKSQKGDIALQNIAILCCTITFLFSFIVVWSSQRRPYKCLYREPWL